MTRKRIERQNTSWRISVEAKRLLERMAERSAISQAAVLEQAIREKARREKITLDADAEEDASSWQRTVRPSASSGLTPEETAAVERLRQLAQKVRSGEDVPPGEIRREMDVLRAGILTTPPGRTGPLDPEQQERIQHMLEEIRAGVPGEWSEEELQERIQKAVEEVRAIRRARGEWPPAVPPPVSPQSSALVAAFQELVEAIRTRHAGMTPEEIEREVEEPVAHARASQRAGRH